MIRAYLLVYPFLSAYVFLGALIGIPYTWLTKDIRLLYWLSRQGIRLALTLSGVKVRLIHLERAWANPGALFVCNHVSNLDPPALFMVLPRIAVILKKELRRIPLLGYIMHLGSFIYVDRKDPKSRRQALETAVATLKSGISLLVFPEGTRSLDGKMLPFRPGSFTTAIEAQQPVVPVTVYGTRELMPKGTLAIRPGEIALMFHEPIPTSGLTTADRAQLMQQVRAVMEEALAGPDPLS